MASIDGLGSGLDTSSIVNSLMSIERQPQARLASQRLAVLSKATTWNQIGVALTAIKTAADALGTGGQLGAATGASSLATTAVMSVGKGAQPGQHTLSVQQLATAGSYGLGVASPTTVVGAGTMVLSRGTTGIGVTDVTAPGTTAGTGTYAVEVRSVSGTSAELVVNGAVSTVDTSSGSFSAGGLTFASAGLTVGKAEVTVARTSSATATVADLAATINSAGGVASASVITSSDPQTGATTTRLLLSSTTTGTAGAVTTSRDGLDALGAGSTVRPASDARFTLDGLSDIVRSSNTVDDLLPGVSISLVAAGPAETTLSVTKDAAAATTAVKGLVTALNSVLTTVSTNSTYNASTKVSGPLSGDSAARGLVARVQDTVTTAGMGQSATLGQIGLTLQRSGTYAFDEAAFSAALAKDPAGTAALVTSLSTGLTALAKETTAPDGLTKAASASATAQAARMQAQVDVFESRLSLTEARLRRQFTALDTALGSLKSQGGYLSTQIAGLPSS